MWTDWINTQLKCVFCTTRGIELSNCNGIARAWEENVLFHVSGFSCALFCFILLLCTFYFYFLTSITKRTVTKKHVHCTYVFFVWVFGHIRGYITKVKENKARIKGRGNIILDGWSRQVKAAQHPQWISCCSCTQFFVKKTMWGERDNIIFSNN